MLSRDGRIDGSVWTNNKESSITTQSVSYRVGGVWVELHSSN